MPENEQESRSLTFVFSSTLHCFESCCLHGLLIADEPVEPPSSQLPQLRVAGREPVRAVPLGRRQLPQRSRARQQPGTGALCPPRLCQPSPRHCLRHQQGLAGRGPAWPLLDHQAGPLQQQEAAGHEVSSCQEKEQKLGPPKKLL